MERIYFFSILILFSSILEGQEWQELNMPDDTTIFHKLCIVDENLWALDYGYGRIFHSKDNGENWSLQYESEGEYLEAIQFIDKKNGYFCGDYGIIMKTIDGGENWKSVSPEYVPGITRTDPMAADSTAIKRYFYQMHFTDKDHGLVWGFEVMPLRGWRASQKSFFYQTKDGGASWDRIEYQRNEFDKVVTNFTSGTEIQDKMAMNMYHYDGVAYKPLRNRLEVSIDGSKTWLAYPFIQFPDDRYMIRTMHFINDHQGYVFGGNLKDQSQAYILETLDKGRSWRLMESDLAHIHYSCQMDNTILLSGKNSLLRKWRPEEKEDSSFIHSGNASRILIDGQIGNNEWSGANKTIIKKGVNLYSLQDAHFLYLSVQYDTSVYTNYYCDLYIELGNDSTLNLHASQQLGERLLLGNEWTESEPEFQWGQISDWTANQINFDRKQKIYLPYQAMEFQISKNKLPKRAVKIALQSRDINWENEVINIPESGDFKTSIDWLLFYWN